jgi:hypothetical protein
LFSTPAVPTLYEKCYIENRLVHPAVWTYWFSRAFIFLACELEDVYGRRMGMGNPPAATTTGAVLVESVDGTDMDPEYERTIELGRWNGKGRISTTTTALQSG